MAVTPVTGQGFNAAASLSLVFTLPAGFVVGDNDVAVITGGANGIFTPTAPTGAVLASASGSTYDAVSTTSTFAYAIALVNGTDVPGTTTYTVSHTNVHDWAGTIGIYRGADLVAIFRDDAFDNEAQATGGTLTAPILTTGQAGDMPVFAWGGRGSGTFTAYSASTEVAQTVSTGTNKRPQAQSYATALASAGSTPASTATFSVTANPHGSYTLLLAAAPAGSTETLRPTGVSGLTNLTGAATDIDEDPDGTITDAGLVGSDPSGTPASVGPSRPTGHAAVTGFTGEFATQANAYDTSTTTAATTTMATASADYGNYFLFSSAVFSAVPDTATVTGVSVEVTDQVGTNNRSDQFYQLGTANGTLVGTEFQLDATTTKQTRTITYAQLGSPSLTPTNLKSGTFGIRVRTRRSNTVTLSLFDLRATVNYTPAGSTVNTQADIAMGDPAGTLLTGAATGEIRARVRKKGSGSNPQGRIEVRNAAGTLLGTAIADTTITDSSASGQLVTGTFNQSIIVSKTDVVLRFVGTGAAGGLAELVAVEWNASVQATARTTVDADLRWAVAARLTKDADLRWAVSQRLTKDTDLRWKVASRFTQDADLRWKVAARLTKDADLRWSVVARLTKDADLRWKVAQRLSKDVDLRWAVYQRLSKDADLRWAVASRLTKDADLRWKVAARLSKDVDLRWRVAQRLSQDVDLRWQVLSTTPRYTVDVDLRWKVAARLSKDVDLRWRVAARLAQDVDLRWKVSERLFRDASLQWAVQARLTKDLDLRWKVAERLAQDADLRWRVAERFWVDADLRWRVLALSAAPAPMPLSVSLIDGIVAALLEEVIRTALDEDRPVVSLADGTQTTLDEQKVKVEIG